jgi:NAD(P)-dependent dehydrogenase (short-subunit alcohol dehydrogenase family)
MSESLREAEGKNGIRVINVAPGYIKTNIHETMGITFEEYCKQLGGYFELDSVNGRRYLSAIAASERFLIDNERNRLASAAAMVTAGRRVHRAGCRLRREGAAYRGFREAPPWQSPERRDDEPAVLRGAV